MCGVEARLATGDDWLEVCGVAERLVTGDDWLMTGNDWLEVCDGKDWLAGSSSSLTCTTGVGLLVTVKSRRLATK